MIQLQSLLPESFSRTSEIQRELEKKYPKVLDKLWVFHHVKPIEYLEVNTIRIYNEFKSQGWGSKIMSDICAYADANMLIISLTPSDSYGSDVNKLKIFYKKFNFQPNTSKKYKTLIDDTMIRVPNQ